MSERPPDTSVAIFSGVRTKIHEDVKRRCFRTVIYAKFIPSKKHWNITPIVADDTVIFVAANYKTDNNVKTYKVFYHFPFI